MNTRGFGHEGDSVRRDKQSHLKACLFVLIVSVGAVAMVLLLAYLICPHTIDTAEAGKALGQAIVSWFHIR